MLSLLVVNRLEIQSAMLSAMLVHLTALVN